jgi:AbrB family looped-hinge helix DNA binding protein
MLYATISKYGIKRFFDMETQSVQIAKSDMDKHGRVLIPAALRNALNFRPGDRLVLRIINGELHIVSIGQLIKSTQALIKSRAKNSSFTVDDFLRERREEEARESAKYND